MGENNKVRKGVEKKATVGRVQCVRRIGRGRGKREKETVQPLCCSTVITKQLNSPFFPSLLHLIA